MESSKLSLSIEHLRSPRSPRRYTSSFIDTPRSELNSGASTPFVSAPSSPRYYYYHSAPTSPPRQDEDAAAVPFSWEEKPGTPKRSAAAADVTFSFGNSSTEAAAGDRASSVDYLGSMGFHFSAPVSPQRDFLSPRFATMKDPWGLSREEDEFEFTSARMSEADSVASVAMSHADELFFQGQLLPLKLPPRLQQQQQQNSALELSHRSRTSGSVHQLLSSPRSPRAMHQSPKSPKSAGIAMLHTRREGRGHQRAHSHFFSSSNSGQEQLIKAPPTRSKASTKKSLRELLHLGASKQQQQQVQSRSSSVSSTGSSQRFSSNANSRSSSTSSTKSSGRPSMSSSRQVSPVSSRELLHYSKVASRNVEELRRKTFMPYKQGLLGFLGCLNVSSVLPGPREQAA